MIGTFNRATASGKTVYADSPDSQSLATMGKTKIWLMSYIGVDSLKAGEKGIRGSLLGSLARFAYGDKVVDAFINIEKGSQNALHSLVTAFERTLGGSDGIYADYVREEAEKTFSEQAAVTPQNVESFKEAMLGAKRHLGEVRYKSAQAILDGKHDADFKAVPASEIPYVQRVIVANHKGQDVTGALKLPVLDTYLEGAKYYTDKIAKLRTEGESSELSEDEFNVILAKLDDTVEKFAAYRDKALGLLGEAKQANPDVTEKLSPGIEDPLREKRYKKKDADRGPEEKVNKPQYTPWGQTEKAGTPQEPLKSAMKKGGLKSAMKQADAPRKKVGFSSEVKVAGLPIDKEERTKSRTGVMQPWGIYNDIELFQDKETTISQLPLKQYMDALHEGYGNHRPKPEEKQQFLKLLNTPLLADAEEKLSAATQAFEDAKGKNGLGLLPQEHRSVLEKMENTQKYLDGLTEAINKVSLLKAGRVDSDKSPQDIKDEAKEAAELISPNSDGDDADAISEAQAAQVAFDTMLARADDMDAELITTYLSAKEELRLAEQLQGLKEAMQRVITM